MIVDSYVLSSFGHRAQCVTSCPMCNCLCNTPPYFVCSPSPVAKCFTLIDGSALVSVLVTMLLVGQ
jgi:hypothetical protein